MTQEDFLLIAATTNHAAMMTGAGLTSTQVAQAAFEAWQGAYDLLQAMPQQLRLRLNDDDSEGWPIKEIL